MNSTVSIIIVSYNNEDTILETLKSIEKQTYKNIELIISDDCSTDNTVYVVKKWIEENERRFTRVELIESDCNTGVALNANRGFRLSTGEFVKIFAGDDILSENYVADMLSAMVKADADVAFCYERVFYESDIKYIGTEYEMLFETRPGSVQKFYLTGDCLYKEVLKSCFFPAPTAMLKRSALEATGGFDENYPFMEDYPLWVKLTRLHAKIVFVETYGVFYRKSSGSTSWRETNEPSSYQKRFIEDLKRFTVEVRIPEGKRMGIDIPAIKNTLGESSPEEHALQMEKKILLYELEKKAHTNKRARKALHKLEWMRINRELNLSHLRQYNRTKVDLKKNFSAKVETFYKLKIQLNNKLMLIRQQDIVSSLDISTKAKMIRTEKKKYRVQRTKYKKYFLKESKRIKEFHSIKSKLKRWDEYVKNYSQYLNNLGFSRIIYGGIKIFSPYSTWMKVKAILSIQRIFNFLVLIFPPRLRKKIVNRYNERIIHKEFKEQLLSSLRFEKEEKNNLLLQQTYLDEIAYQKKYVSAEKRSGPIRILFVITHISLFSAVESIYLSMLKDERFNPQLLLVPVRQPGMQNYYYYDKGLIEQIDSRGYDYDLGYKDGRWKSLFEFDPEGVFFQTPYRLQRHPIYDYTYRTAFPKIMYTPYGPWVMDASVEDFIKSGLKPDFFNKLWRAFMDKMSLEMLYISAPQYKEKSILSGSPKVDFHRQGLSSIKYCWKNPDDIARKRIIWMPRWGIADKRTSFSDYYEKFMYLLETRSDIDFVFRPHPLLIGDLKKTGFFTEQEMERVFNFFERSNSTIDYDNDYREGLLSCDFLIMDFSSIIYEFLPTGKPVIYTIKDNTLLDGRIMEACYVVKNWEELSDVMQKLLDGIDPLKKRREEIVKELNYFPGGVTNGMHIAEYIAEYIRCEDIENIDI